VQIRRIATAVATFVVAIVVALALPVSQLRTVETVQDKCCCPDPAHCKCPEHKPGHTNKPQLKDCHRTSHDVTSPPLPAFEPPKVALVAPAVRIVGVVLPVPARPHDSPPPARPDAPS
jgi:hypothetical protein